MGRVLNSEYAYLNQYGEWIQHPEVCDLIVMGCAWELPADLPFGFPGWAREITAAEAEQFMAELPPRRSTVEVWKPLDVADMVETWQKEARQEIASLRGK